MKIEIHTQELFKGHATGGLDFGDWLALNDEGKLKQRLSFIASRSAAITEQPYSTDSGLPANAWGDAMQLEEKAVQALQAANDRDFITAAMLALDVGLMLEELNKLLAAYAGLKVRAEIQKPRSEGGKSTAEVKREQQQENIKEVVRRWEKLARDERPERERAGIIALQMGHPVNTVRGWIRKAGLR